MFTMLRYGGPMMRPLALNRTCSTVLPDARDAGALRALLIVGFAVWCACILGLASRHAFSVSFWPANAVLAGLLV
jgi:hypothetical protein